MDFSDVVLRCSTLLRLARADVPDIYKTVYDELQDSDPEKARLMPEPVDFEAIYSARIANEELERSAVLMEQPAPIIKTENRPVPPFKSSLRRAIESSTLPVHRGLALALVESDRRKLKEAEKEERRKSYLPKSRFRKEEALEEIKKAAIPGIQSVSLGAKLVPVSGCNDRAGLNIPVLSGNIDSVPSELITVKKELIVEAKRENLEVTLEMDADKNISLGSGPSSPNLVIDEETDLPAFPNLIEDQVMHARASLVNEDSMVREIDPAPTDNIAAVMQADRSSIIEVAAVTQVEPLTTAGIAEDTSIVSTSTAEVAEVTPDNSTMNAGIAVDAPIEPIANAEIAVDAPIDQITNVVIPEPSQSDLANDDSIGMEIDLVPTAENLPNSSGSESLDSVPGQQIVPLVTPIPVRQSTLSKKGKAKGAGPKSVKLKRLIKQVARPKSNRKPIPSTKKSTRIAAKTGLNLNPVLSLVRVQIPAVAEVHEVPATGSRPFVEFDTPEDEPIGETPIRTNRRAQFENPAEPSSTEKHHIKLKKMFRTSWVEMCTRYNVLLQLLGPVVKNVADIERPQFDKNNMSHLKEAVVHLHALEDQLVGDMPRGFMDPWAWRKEWNAPYVPDHQHFSAGEYREGFLPVRPHPDYCDYSMGDIIKEHVWPDLVHDPRDLYVVNSGFAILPDDFEEIKAKIEQILRKNCIDSLDGFENRLGSLKRLLLISFFPSVSHPDLGAQQLGSFKHFRENSGFSFLLERYQSLQELVKFIVTDKISPVLREKMTNHDVLTFVKAVARGVRSICRTDRLRRQRGFMTRTLGASVEFAKTVNLYRQGRLPDQILAKKAKKKSAKRARLVDHSVETEVNSEEEESDDSDMDFTD